MRPAPVLLIALACVAGQRAAEPDLFSSDSVIELTLKAPLSDLFAKDENKDASVTGALSFRSADGREVTLDNVAVSERGNTSKQASECRFPKLKLAAREERGARRLDIPRHGHRQDRNALRRVAGRHADEEVRPPRERACRAPRGVRLPPARHAGRPISPSAAGAHHLQGHVGRSGDGRHHAGCDDSRRRTRRAETAVTARN